MNGRQTSNPLILGLIQSEQIALPQFISAVISHLCMQVRAKISHLNNEAEQIEEAMFVKEDYPYSSLHAVAVLRRHAHELETSLNMLSSYQNRHSRLQLFTAANGTSYLFLDEIALIASLNAYLENYDEIETKLNLLLCKHTIAEGKIVDNYQGREGRTYLVFTSEQKMKLAIETLSIHFSSLSDTDILRKAKQQNTIEILSQPLVEMFQAATKKSARLGL